MKSYCRVDDQTIKQFYQAVGQAVKTADFIATYRYTPTVFAFRLSWDDHSSARQQLQISCFRPDKAGGLSRCQR